MPGCPPQLPAHGRGLSSCQSRAQRQPFSSQHTASRSALMNLSWRARRLLRHMPQGHRRLPAPAAEPEYGGGGGSSRGGQGAAPESKPESRPQQVCEHDRGSWSEAEREREKPRRNEEEAEQSPWKNPGCSPHLLFKPRSGTFVRREPKAPSPMLRRQMRPQTQPPTHGPQHARRADLPLTLAERHASWPGGWGWGAVRPSNLMPQPYGTRPTTG